MMNFIRSTWAPAIVCIVVVIAISISVIFAIEKEKHSCNRVVFLEGELSRDVNSIEYLGQGNVARIHYCDGKTEEMPTSRIVKVIIK
jgi:hypothetical protein